MAADHSETLRMLYAFLPGPDRKRTESSYTYRLTYCNPQHARPRCILIWDVSGGRMPYQIALERDEAGTLSIHCTCADAVFRAEDEGRFCKHVRGLLQGGRTDQSEGDALPLGA